MRARWAKQREHDIVCGLASCACGDFLQLPPLGGPSLAMAWDDAGYVRELGEEPQLGKGDDKGDHWK